MRMIIVCLFMLFAIADDLSAQIMRMGQSPSGNIILTMDKNRIRRGNSDTYYKDDSSQDWGWYWNVRDGLEALCGTKLVIVEKDTWERQSTRKKQVN